MHGQQRGARHFGIHEDGPGGHAGGPAAGVAGAVDDIVGGQSVELLLRDS